MVTATDDVSSHKSQMAPRYEAADRRRPGGILRARKNSHGNGCNVTACTWQQVYRVSYQDSTGSEYRVTSV